MEALKSIIIHILNELAKETIFETRKIYFTYKARPQTFKLRVLWDTYVE